MILVKEIGNTLVGWLYHEELLEKGLLEKEVCPQCLNDDQVHICITHFPVWSAVYSKIMNSFENGHYWALSSIGEFKDFQQYNYNK